MKQRLALVQVHEAADFVQPEALEPWELAGEVAHRAARVTPGEPAACTRNPLGSSARHAQEKLDSTSERRVDKGKLVGGPLCGRLGEDSAPLLNGGHVYIPTMATFASAGERGQLGIIDALH